MELNIFAILVAALIPIAIGFLWYNPKVFGNAWMREAEVSEEKLKTGNMPVIFIISFILSFLLAFFVKFITIHQTGALGMVGGDLTKALPSYTAFMADYGDAFRTFKHGALHGTMAGFLFVLPVIAINSLFERKSWKYIWINSGYWIVCLAIMGAIICGWR